MPPTTHPSLALVLGHRQHSTTFTHLFKAEKGHLFQAPLLYNIILKAPFE